MLYILVLVIGLTANFFSTMATTWITSHVTVHISRRFWSLGERANAKAINADGGI